MRYFLTEKRLQVLDEIFEALLPASKVFPNVFCPPIILSIGFESQRIFSGSEDNGAVPGED
jgi:hypothetical protein